MNNGIKKERMYALEVPGDDALTANSGDLANLVVVLAVGWKQSAVSG